ncbi:hypothetical protein EHS13_28410 [Paenibacillus psychroresistens]|uniref:Uncharacterized protein n=1 Tax=Paenibacillus psychroresistens TaxID=1778678 RepID=A0A6B8RST8_9BACL|nr:hypothetical protein [Paenibacillus psychroresistens]QGQ98523.1 hypothetical protein EHS13_28410 [Paenibacillus psychroresistens]
MMYSNILSKEELEALLTPEELEVFKTEQQDTVEHELMLNPAHLLLALRELEDTVGRLTARVGQLEDQLALKPLLLEPEILQVVNKVIETALFEMPIVGLEASLDNNELDDDTVVTDYRDVILSNELDEQQTEIEAETYIEPEFEPQLEDQIELKTEELNEQEVIDELVEIDELEENMEISEDEKAMLLASDSETIGDEADSLVESDSNHEPDRLDESEQISETGLYSTDTPQESSLISRSARHRERKPSFMSRLLK